MASKTATATPVEVFISSSTSATPAAADAVGALDSLVDKLGKEHRPGQRAMVAAVATAIAQEKVTLVEAPTGTGKSVAYLTAAIRSERRSLVSTATKALQEQLVHTDLPDLVETIRKPDGSKATFALLKGRSNYLCVSKLRNLDKGQQQLDAFDADTSTIKDLLAWSATPGCSGDRADAPVAASDQTWSKLSVGPAECPGKKKCSNGDVCFAEFAKEAAAEADIVVVNTHLLVAHIASGGFVLPDADVVIVDEAHELPDIAADGLGADLSPGRIRHARRQAVRVLADSTDLSRTLDRAAANFEDAIASLEEQVLPRKLPDVLADALDEVQLVCDAAGEQIREIASKVSDRSSHKDQLVSTANLFDAIKGDVDRVHDIWGDEVALIRSGAVQVRSTDVSDAIAFLCERSTLVATSATLRTSGSFDSLADRLGLGTGVQTDLSGDDADTMGCIGRLEGGSTFEAVSVPSPFDTAHGLLYCAMHLPEPNSPQFRDAAINHTAQLVTAAGGRSLVLCTSKAAAEQTAQELRTLLPELGCDVKVWDQWEAPRRQIVDAFLADHSSVLVATMGFWTGFDPAGDTCTLVVIDRIPFPQRNDALLEARRKAATRRRVNGFDAVDLPHASTLLAQGAGRLLRTGSDRGAVAILDRRFGTARYRWDLIRSLPTWKRTKEPAEVMEFLSGLHATL